MTERDRKRQLKASFKAQERAVLEASLPLSKAELRALFEYLDRPDAPPCDHTLRETTDFLQRRRIDPKGVLPWLHQHGGYCDCEVGFNVVSTYGDLVGYGRDV